MCEKFSDVIKEPRNKRLQFLHGIWKNRHDMRAL